MFENVVINFLRVASIYREGWVIFFLILRKILPFYPRVKCGWARDDLHCDFGHLGLGK